MELVSGSNSISFEEFKNQNGLTYWWASEFMVMLGYDDIISFQPVVDRATKSMLSSKIPHQENIIYEKREVEGGVVSDIKLTRFACYMCAMNADPKREEVAEAQRYFVETTRKYELELQKRNDLDRVLFRDEIVEGNKSLASIATKSGVKDFARFQNAGYRGMYNMLNYKLANLRGIKKEKVIDHMGRTELAANLFRITQTEERIKSKGVRGQNNLERTHHDVGKEVRKIVIKNTGLPPERLPVEAKIPDVKSRLKKNYKEIKKIDK